MDQKPRYDKYVVNRDAPLFIRVANNQADASTIAEGLISNTYDDITINLASIVKEQNPDISIFREDLRNLLLDLITQGVTPQITQYLNSYMESSLLVHEQNESVGVSGHKLYWLSIKQEGTPWLEALVCYNLSVYIKAFGINFIKECPSCHKFFLQGKMKYKYCSEVCKTRSSTNES
jgi:hypothetical protein